jgi:hypothetical protein
VRWGRWVGLKIRLGLGLVVGCVRWGVESAWGGC